MGQKVNPIGFRIGNSVDWKSAWFASDSTYSEFVVQDVMIAKCIKDLAQKRALKDVSGFNIKRFANNEVVCALQTDKVNALVGKNGENLAKIAKKIKKFAHKNVKINVDEIKMPIYASATLISQLIGDRIIANSSIKDIIKNCREMVANSESRIQNRGKVNVLGIKVEISGRINGAEIARTEKYSFGRLTFSSLNVNFDYAQFNAVTSYGVIGIKVYLAKEELFYS